jgi:hypothetical protein
VQFPIAAAHGFGDLPHINPDDDLITPKLTALQLYQLSILAPNPTVAFDKAAAARGDELFSGKAECKLSCGATVDRAGLESTSARRSVY